MGDVGYFSPEVTPKTGDYVLVKDESTFALERFSKTVRKTKVQAVLIALEKRYLQR
jgi:hypothetical protein